MLRIEGADKPVSNSDGTHWKDTKQVAAVPCRLFKLSIASLTSTDVYVWIFDLSAGSGASAAPVMVRYVPGGYADTWDFGPDGSLFVNGIYIALSSAGPVTPVSTVTASGNDKAILRAEIRQ